MSCTWKLMQLFGSCLCSSSICPFPYFLQLIFLPHFLILTPPLSQPSPHFLFCCSFLPFFLLSSASFFSTPFYYFLLPFSCSSSPFHRLLIFFYLLVSSFFSFFSTSFHLFFPAPCNSGFTSDIMELTANLVGLLGWGNGPLQDL